MIAELPAQHCRRTADPPGGRLQHRDPARRRRRRGARDRRERHAPPRANASLVAHLSASGSPILTTFVNDTAPAPAGQGRIVVRHTAAAPAVDVLANGSPTFTNVTNPNEGQTNLPAGTIDRVGGRRGHHDAGAHRSGRRSRRSRCRHRRLRRRRTGEWQRREHARCGHAADPTSRRRCERRHGHFRSEGQGRWFPTFAVAVLGVSLLGLTVTFGALRRAHASA